MSRDTIQLTIPDLSRFAKALRAELETPPSHLETLGLLARAAGYRNYQHLRAAHEPAPLADQKRVARALAHFDGQGQLMRWPGKTQIQALCLWAIWAQIPARESFSERQISTRIDACCLFKDAAQIRRSMIENRMLTRTLDGAVYTRLEQAPSPEGKALIAQLNGRK